MIEFPEAKLIALAELYENIGHAWEPVTAQTRPYREDMAERATAAREAIDSYKALAEEHAQLAQENAELRRRCRVLEYGTSSIAD